MTAIVVRPDPISICRVPADAPIRAWATLGTAGVTLFPIAACDTDSLPVRRDQLDAAITALRGAGREVTGETR